MGELLVPNLGQALQGRHPARKVRAGLTEAGEADGGSDAGADGGFLIARQAGENSLGGSGGISVVDGFRRGIADGGPQSVRNVIGFSIRILKGNLVDVDQHQGLEFVDLDVGYESGLGQALGHAGLDAFSPFHGSLSGTFLGTGKSANLVKVDHGGGKLVAA